MGNILTGITYLIYFIMIKVIKKSIKALKSWFFNKFIKKRIEKWVDNRWHTDFLKHGLTKAFTLDGIDYYEFTDPLNMPHKRGLVGMEYLASLNRKLTDKELKLGLNSMMELINANKLGDARAIISDMLERDRWQTEPITLMQVATVLYITDKEDPYDYDYAYNQEKLKVFINHADFFLPLLLKHFVDQFNLSPRDTLIYSMGLIMKQQDMLRRPLSTNISTELKQELQSEILTRDGILAQLQHLLSTLPHYTK